MVNACWFWLFTLSLLYFISHLFSKSRKKKDLKKPFGQNFVILLLYMLSLNNHWGIQHTTVWVSRFNGKTYLFIKKLKLIFFMQNESFKNIFYWRTLLYGARFQTKSQYYSSDLKVNLSFRVIMNSKHWVMSCKKYKQVAFQNCLIVAKLWLDDT